MCAQDTVRRPGGVRTGQQCSHLGAGQGSSAERPCSSTAHTVCGRLLTCAELQQPTTHEPCTMRASASARSCSTLRVPRRTSTPPAEIRARHRPLPCQLMPLNSLVGATVATATATAASTKNPKNPSQRCRQATGACLVRCMPSGMPGRACLLHKLLKQLCQGGLQHLHVRPQLVAVSVVAGRQQWPSPACNQEQGVRQEQQQRHAHRQGGSGHSLVCLVGHLSFAADERPARPVPRGEG